MSIALTVIVVALLLDRFLRDRAFDRERRGLLNRLEARNVAELAVLNRSEAPRLAPKKPREPDENGLRPSEHPVGL